MWKLLSAVIADQIYGRLDQQKLPEEQKGFRKRSTETNLAIALIDYKQAYDMVRFV